MWGLGCVPFRINYKNRAEVLLVESNRRNDWIFPKGGWESDEKDEECAKREAFEEAGVRKGGRRKEEGGRGGD